MSPLVAFTENMDRPSAARDAELSGWRHINQYLPSDEEPARLKPTYANRKARDCRALISWTTSVGLPPSVVEKRFEKPFWTTITASELPSKFQSKLPIEAPRGVLKTNS